MASAAAAKVEKPSFAKILAAGIKSSNVQSKILTAENASNRAITSPVRDNSPQNQPSQPTFTSPLTISHGALLVDGKETILGDLPTPGVLVNEPTASTPSNIQTPEVMVLPAASDEAGTQISSNGSVKVPSLDGKSVASGTTFALDEKESLRPDDSASVMAQDDEEVLALPGAASSSARSSNHDDLQAFSNQLREISDMDPARQPGLPHAFGHNGHSGHGMLYIPPDGPGIGHVPGSLRPPPGADAGVDVPPDPKLLEALDSPKDRIMVLKLEQDIVDFVKDAKETSLTLPQTNAFYRMLAHKLADYYMLGHAVDDSTTAVRIFKTLTCRLPPPLTGIATPSTAASTPPPAAHQMKILRRGMLDGGPTIANGSHMTSKTTSENGESGNEDDKRITLPQSREEREARYEAARKRIMGSERPSDSLEASIEKANSRSSSATGKKGGRKKQRADDDDDFEARSAYSAYYPAAMTPSASTGAPYTVSNGVPPYMHQPSHSAYPYPAGPGGHQQYGDPTNHAWSTATVYSQPTMPNWTPPQPSGYDLSREFQQSMSFQSPPMQSPNSSMQQPGFNMQYSQQPGSTQQQPWPQQGMHMPNYAPQTMMASPQGFASGGSPASHQGHERQPYAYGQLPSQTFPGRPPSKLEHPLPGSYKGKHFNPQSQSFVPGHANGGSPMQHQSPTSPMLPGVFGAGLGLSHMPPRPNGPPVAPAYTSPLPTSHQMRTPTHPMTHPLPQPVVPKQPSPNLPLPVKPTATPPRPQDRSNTGSAAMAGNVSTTQGPSGSIAKWGMPASLPAKPPPANEPVDAARFMQSQPPPVSAVRPPPHNPLPSFGSMPPPQMLGGYGAQGQGMQSRRM
ncbi:hypothetical protein BDY17DRAFT_326865 [Neohortaea acidophila]|uniref:SUZ domain-containing protein n=1 Tax=Neohortaea acidophila TaxID=245834 RepID=A0A6A6PKR3_9PEZI|nr:uncharacterized protein BDY17DRAFT_326865 [Neohortaea acidophila]KAF2479857.1 hypothetical protein BDY17DRAFT_326865 [Neohortaea acidophila]